MIDENHRGSFRYIGIAKKTNHLATRADVYCYVPADLLQVFCNPARNAVERNNHDDRNALSRLNIRESLNGFREPARSWLRCVFRSVLNDSDGGAR